MRTALTVSAAILALGLASSAYADPAQDVPGSAAGNTDQTLETPEPVGKADDSSAGSASGSSGGTERPAQSDKPASQN